MFHKPQDSIGVYIDRKTIGFGIADGVSIVNGSLKNESGELSYALIKMLPHVKNDWLTEIKKSVQHSKRAKKKRASTFIGGKIQKTSNGFHVQLFFIASPVDTGLNLLYNNGRLSPIPNFSSGFLPDHYLPYEHTFSLKSKFHIILSSDGAIIKEHALIHILHTIEKIDNHIELLYVLHQNIITSFDDQCLLIISSI